MKIYVTDHAGKEHHLEAPEGWRIMEIIRDWEVGIKAECGGACSCATCHVYVDKDWRDKLIEPTEEELDMLDTAPAVEDYSRLACQIIMRQEFDGLRVSLAPGSECD